MMIVADQFAASLERLAHKEKMEVAGRALAKAHRDLREAQRKSVAADELAAAIGLLTSISREINDPLAVIVGNVQCLLAQRSALDQKGLSRLKRIETSALRISEISRKLASEKGLSHPGVAHVAGPSESVQGR
jgi:C4-dicarboxylate-specific signal transduction histidine kinase